MKCRKNWLKIPKIETFSIKHLLSAHPVYWLARQDSYVFEHGEFIFGISFEKYLGLPTGKRQLKLCYSSIDVHVKFCNHKVLALH